MSVDILSFPHSYHRLFCEFSSKKRRIRTSIRGILKKNGNENPLRCVIKCALSRDKAFITPTIGGIP